MINTRTGTSVSYKCKNHASTLESNLIFGVPSISNYRVFKTNCFLMSFHISIKMKILTKLSQIPEGLIVKADDKYCDICKNNEYSSYSC